MAVWCGCPGPGHGGHHSVLRVTASCLRIPRDDVPLAGLGLDTVTNTATRKSLAEGGVVCHNLVASADWPGEAAMLARPGQATLVTGDQASSPQQPGPSRHSQCYSPHCACVLQSAPRQLTRYPSTLPIPWPCRPSRIVSPAAILSQVGIVPGSNLSASPGSDCSLLPPLTT